MKKTIFSFGIAFLVVICGTVATHAFAAITPPPAYIETHQTQPQPNNIATSTSATTIPVPPTIIPQDLPADQGVVAPDFTVTSVVVVETKPDAQTSALVAKVIEFQGHATPNTYVTLYIYSTPIIVTVKTDSQGNWKYNLNQELDNGIHRVYVAQIDNTGNVVAKSDPIFFTKAAASVQVVSSESLPVEPQQVNFFQQYFIVIASAIVVLAIIITLTIVGLMRRKVTDLPIDPPANIQ